MQNNCVSVSVARLDHYRNVNQLWKETYGQPLPDRPLYIDEIIDLLSRTGYDYECKEFVADGGKTAYQVFDSTDDLGSLYDSPKSGDDEMLFCYYRSDGSGHCVIYVREAWAPPPVQGVPTKTKRRFLDFQHDEDGEGGLQLKEDIEDAEEITVLYAMKYRGPEGEWRKAMAKRAERRQALIDAGLTPAWH